MTRKNQNPEDIRQIKQATPSCFKFAATEGKIEGYASIFGNVDSYGDRVVKGAFTSSIKRYTAESRMPAMLWQHKTDEPIGRWTEMHEDDVGLWMAGDFNMKTSRGKDAYQHTAAGDVTGLSIGYETVRSIPNGAVRDLLELRLMETSIVTFPANPKTRITGIKAESSADIERILREGGLPRVFAAKFAKAGWAALARQAEQESPAIESLLATVKAARLELKKD